MKRSILFLATLIAPALALSQMQQAPPRIGYVFPAGAQQGSHVKVVVGGQFLESTSDAYFSGDGIEATIVEHFKPLPPGQAGFLRDQLKDLRERKRAHERASQQASTRPATSPATAPAWTAEDDKKIADILKKLATFRPRIPNPAISETVTLDVTIAPNAKPGPHAIRLAAAGGLTNPLNFHIGALPEAQEQENPESAKAREVSVASLPAILNGQIMPGDVDRYRFSAKQGRKIVAVVSARELVPYIADAVPGWFQATLAIFNAKGEQLAFADNFRFNPDPALCFSVPSDGDYILEIRDSIYRGREDFVYRITLGELPFVTSIFPLGSELGQKRQLQIAGWNLPYSKFFADGNSPLISPKGAINATPFALDDLPDLFEHEPNDSPSAAERVPVGRIINGRIDKPGDWDVFRIEANAGDEIVADVRARRLNSPLDSILRITDGSGKQLAVSDDSPDIGSGLNTHHADSFTTLKIPASGAYYVQIGDTQNKGAETCAYRLRISRPIPDFELRVVPASITARAGGAAPITVHAVRRDGYSGEINLSLFDAPTGYHLDAARIPAGQQSVRLTLQVPRSATTKPVALQLQGIAKINGAVVTHRAVPAEDMMQAFAYHHLVPFEDLLVLAAGRSAPSLDVELRSKLPLRLTPGGSAQLVFSSPSAPWLGAISYELSDPPPGLSIARTTATDRETTVLLKSDAANTKPFSGNLIVNGYATPRAAAATRPNAGVRRRLALTLPAIPLEIAK